MVVSTNSLVHKISKDIPAHAAFAEPLSCALHAIERANLQFKDVVVIAGAGPIGLSMIAGAVAKSPAEIIALDMDERKLEIAKKTGATRTINIAKEDALVKANYPEDLAKRFARAERGLFDDEADTEERSQERGVA